MAAARDTRVELPQLAAFVAVGEELSFSRAADRLETTQPPVSRLVRRLEERLGLVLFERTSHSVVLTAAGEALLPAARTVRRPRPASTPPPRRCRTAAAC